MCINVFVCICLCVFEELYDLSDAAIYKLQTRPSGVVFIGLLPKIYFTSTFTANVEKGGLRIQNKPIRNEK